VQAGKPTWTSSSFLLYAGGLTVLVSAIYALSYLSDRYGDAAFVGWSALVMAVLALVAAGFRARGEWIAAGVFAVATVVSFGVFAGAVEAWWGWLPSREGGLFGGFHLGVLLLELLIVVAALVAIRVFRFPLLGAVAALVGWYFVTDVLSSGGNWSAVVTLLVGLVFLILGWRIDRGPRQPYGFWLHAVAGLIVGGSLIFFWHHGDLRWALIAVGGLVYVALARLSARSSWAVLGAVGFLLAGAHFAIEWSRGTFGFFVDGEGQSLRAWVPPAVFAFVGFLLVVLGLLARRRAVGAATGH
jgi:hypothetical protein